MYSYPTQGGVKSRLSYWTRHPYSPRWSWGLWMGWFFAAAYSLFVVGLALLQRSTYFARYDVSLWRILVVYWIAGTLAGLVLALAYPLSSSRIGSALLGFVVGLVVYSTVGVGMLGWRMAAIVTALIPALVIGTGLGVVSYDDEHPEQSKRLANGRL